MDNQRLLIISNNVLSTTKNNGKTILSYFDRLPKDQIYQLYFSSEMPSIDGYRYFQLSDSDVLHGWLSPAKRGRAVQPIQTDAAPAQAAPAGVEVPKKTVFRIAREFLWLGHWKSAQLLTWLDDVQPTAIFFVGGDCGFAYNICRFIAKRYKARLTLYITDDYVVPYAEDSLLVKLRKHMLRKKIKTCLRDAACFYTVSPPMQREYEKLFGHTSELAVNLPDSLKREEIKNDREQLTLLYAGSLYYGRADVLGEVTKALQLYNKTAPGKKAILNVYTNEAPSDEIRAIIENGGAGKCCGSLDKEGLTAALNAADILVFAESFDGEQIRKTRFSLSTKIPEYLSVGKPVLAIGPQGIGSMDHIADAAFCINQPEDISKKVCQLLSSAQLQEELAQTGLKKYETHHNKCNLQPRIIKNVMGTRD